MSADSQQRLRSLLAAYNVFATKLRQHKVTSGTFVVFNDRATVTAQLCCAVHVSVLVAAVVVRRLCAVLQESGHKSCARCCRVSAVPYHRHAAWERTPQVLRRPSAGWPWRASWRCRQRRGSRCSTSAAAIVCGCTSWSACAVSCACRCAVRVCRQCVVAWLNVDAVLRAVKVAGSILITYKMQHSAAANLPEPPS